MDLTRSYFCGDLTLGKTFVEAELDDASFTLGKLRERAAKRDAVGRRGELLVLVAEHRSVVR